MILQDEPDVRWVASQPIPALQALIREAERDNIHRQSHQIPSSPPPPRSFPPLRAPPPSSTKPPRKEEEEEEPEAVAFVELLKNAFKKLDENSLKKQRLVARTRPLTKTASTSAIAGPSTRLSHSTSASASYGRTLAKTASLGPCHTRNSDPKSASAPLPVRASTEDDTIMRDVIDLTEKDTDSDRPVFAPASCADTTMYMQTDNDDDDDDSDTPMDMSFLRAEPPPQTRVLPQKLKQQLAQSDTASAPTQRTRTGPPPLGMRRAPLLQPSQYSSSQGTKGVTVPRFKPPLLTNTARTPNKSDNGTKPATTSSKPLSRGLATKVAVVPKAAQRNKDPDSSFDVSFDMDVDALEEAMKAYD